jgi:hypothetical protein
MHSAVVSPDGEGMVVVGGSRGSGPLQVFFADAWIFHFGTDRASLTRNTQHGTRYTQSEEG